MKLSIISPSTIDACFIYRCHPWTRLNVDAKLYSGKDGFQLWDAVLHADVVLMQRPFTSQQVGIAQTVKAAGKRLVVDWDDDLSCLPPWNPNAAHFKDCLPHLQALCRAADVVTVSSAALFETVKSWGASKPVFIPNAIDDSWRTLQPSQQRSKSVLWRGGNSHSADLEEGREYLKAMNETHEIIFFGDKPSWAYTLRHRHFGVSDYANYIVMMNSLAPEIVAVPLVDHPFNHAKSDIAAQESGLIAAKLWHNGIGEFAQHRLNTIPQVRWLSDVNHKRQEILCSLQ